MKKYNIFFLFTLLSLFVTAQCTFNLTDNWTNLTPCAPATVTVSGTTLLGYTAIDGGLEPCTGGTVTIQLQRFNGITWSVTQSVVKTMTSVSPAQSQSYSFTIGTNGTYRIVGIPSAGSLCGGCGFTTLTKPQQVVTINTAPTSSYRVDGVVVNSSTFIQTYTCQALRMTNIAWTGTSSGTGSFGYQWRVEIQKIGVSIDGGSWAPGTPPPNYDLKGRIGLIWGSSNLTGQYNVILWVKNNCNTAGVAYTGKVQINASPTATTSCFRISTNNACNTFAVPGTQSSPANVCAGSPKINGQCSGGQYIGGYYRLLVEEWTTANVFVQNVVNTSNITINNSNDILCLDMNVLSSPQGYFFSNPAGRKYKVRWTIGNVCGESFSEGWFVDNIGGCKTDGEELAIGIEDENKEADHFSVYPNPATNMVNISWLQNNHETAPATQLFAMDGKLLEIPIQVVGKGEIQLDVSSLAKGVYTV